MNQVSRTEKKYMLTYPEYAVCSHQFSNILTQDSHNETNGYLVRSLYFDTLDDSDFYDKIEGLETRRKIRLRLYEPSGNFAMLEMKQKQGAYQLKRSLRLERADAELLAKGDYRPLLNYKEPFAAECYGLMNYRCYRPRTIVQYQRKAFIAKENKIRITLDSHITATESNYNLFSTQLPLYPVLDRFHAVLEVKYNGFLLSYIKDMINQCSKSELAVSKYCLGRGISLNYIF